MPEYARGEIARLKEELQEAILQREAVEKDWNDTLLDLESTEADLIDAEARCKVGARKREAAKSLDCSTPAISLTRSCKHSSERCSTGEEVPQEVTVKSCSSTVEAVSC